MVDWRDLATMTDKVVDGQFGEPVRFIPWSSAGYVEGGPDPSRAPTDTIACVVIGDSEVQNSAGHTSLVGGFASRVADTEVIVSITDDKIPPGLRKGDRINLVQRGFTCEFNFLVPGDTGRSELHLLRVKDEET